MMDPMLFAIAITTAGAVSFGVLVLVQQQAAPRREVSRRLELAERPGVQRPGVLRKRRGRGGLIRRLPISAEGRESTQIDLDRAGVRWRVQEFLALRLALAVTLGVGGAIVLLAVGFPAALAAIGALALVIVGWMLPRQYVARKHKRRSIQIEEQLPDALTRIAKSLRVGTGLMQSLAFTAEETPAPLGPEFASVLRDLQLGADPIEAFTAFADRTGNPDLDIAITAIIIQRSVGGNLSEILGNVSNTIRERAKIQREVRVLVTRQMLQANMTAALPVLTALGFIFLTPDIGGKLLNTTAGNIALVFALVSEALGIFVVRRMAIIKV